MRILVVNQYFYPDQASTSQLLTELCQDLSESHEVTVVCGRPSYSPAEAGRPGGMVQRQRLGDVRILRTWSTSYSRHSLAGRLTNYGSYLTSSLVGIMKAEHPDVILTMTDPPIVAAAALLASKVRGVPFVYVNQDVFPEVAVTLGALGDGAGADALRRLNAALRSSAARVVAIGRDMRERLLQLGAPPERLHLIPNWADSATIRPSPDGARKFRAEHGWSERFVVMHSGNVGLSQDLEALLDAAELLRDDQGVVFAIIGEGGSKDALMHRVTDSRLANVTFHPYEPKTALSSSLGAADLQFIGLRRGLAGLIVPSKAYGVMAAGRPFLAAVESGSEIDLIAEEHGCGLRVEPDDPQAIADGIVKAKGMDLNAMGTAGRQAMVERFDRRIATGAYRDLLERVATTTGD